MVKCPNLMLLRCESTIVSLGPKLTESQEVQQCVRVKLF